MSGRDVCITRFGTIILYNASGRELTRKRYGYRGWKVHLEAWRATYENMENYSIGIIPGDPSKLVKPVHR